MVKHELRVASYYLRAESLKPRVKIQNWEYLNSQELQVQIYKLKFMSYEFNFTCFEFKSTSYGFKSIKLPVQIHKLWVQE